MMLPDHFYARPTLDVARDLIGKVLVRRDGRRTMSGKIVETEAYVGTEDLACHASKGRTKRTEVMFGPPGRAYVYLIYGMYCCLNVVTEREGFPGAVLIRAIEPLTGLGEMTRNRGRELAPEEIANGPGKLCQAMAVDRQLNGQSFRTPRLRIEDRGLIVTGIVQSPRINVDYAGVWRDRRWRFFVGGDPHVSKHRLNEAAIPARD